VLLNSYFKLSQLLPVEKILHKLITARVIDLDDEEEIMSLTTTRKKAVYILHKIAAPLEAGYTEKFYQLLTIMKEYGGDVAKLADEIRMSLKGKFNICKMAVEHNEGFIVLIHSTSQWLENVTRSAKQGICTVDVSTHLCIHQRALVQWVKFCIVHTSYLHCFM